MSHNWDKFADKSLEFFNGIALGMCEIGQQLKHGWPNLAIDPTLILVSDYSGEHRKAPYYVFTFLISDIKDLASWFSERGAIRKHLLKDKRRMSYKDLRDRVRQSAIVPFLQAANQIQGVLFSVLVSKKLTDIYLLKPDSTPASVRSKWKVHVWQKLMAIAHFGGFLIGGISAPEQNVNWFTDDDEIFPNVDRADEVTEIIAHLCNHFSHHQMGHFRFGAAGICDPGDRWLEDTLAIPDLVGGALSELFENLDSKHKILSDTIITPTPHSASTNCNLILSWLADNDQPLRKVVCRILPGKSPGKVVMDWPKIHGLPQLPNAPIGLWLPESMRRDRFPRNQT